MKVIEYPDMEWTAEHTCSKCFAKLLIEIEDLKKSGNDFYVNCVVCNAYEYPKNKLPWYVERYASRQHVLWPPGHHLHGKDR